VPNAIIYHGAKPVYVDIEPQMFNIDNCNIALNRVHYGSTIGLLNELKKDHKLSNKLIKRL
jgi:hypothetical protein